MARERNSGDGQVARHTKWRESGKEETELRVPSPVKESLVEAAIRQAKEKKARADTPVHHSGIYRGVVLEKSVVREGGHTSPPAKAEAVLPVHPRPGKAKWWEPFLPDTPAERKSFWLTVVIFVVGLVVLGTGFYGHFGCGSDRDQTSWEGSGTEVETYYEKDAFQQ